MSSWFTGVWLHRCGTKATAPEASVIAVPQWAQPRRHRTCRPAPAAARRIGGSTFPAVATKDPYWRQHSWRLLYSTRCRALETTPEQRVSMSRMTGTTAVTAGLGTLVLLNAVLSWGTQRTQPQVRQDITRPSAAVLDPAVALQLQLRPGAWRHWPAPTDDPAAATSLASSPRQSPAPTMAAQPKVMPVASLAEPPPTLDRTIPVEPLTRSMAPPP